MREIKGPADCTPYVGIAGEMQWTNKKGEAVKFFTAGEVGQIIALAMDAALSECDEWSSPRGDAEAMAWRELSERLKGM